MPLASSFAPVNGCVELVHLFFPPRSNQLSSNTFKKDVWKFQGPWQVEIVARCVRQWVDEETLDEGALALAEAIIKVRLQVGSCGRCLVQAWPRPCLMHATNAIPFHEAIL